MPCMSSHHRPACIIVHPPPILCVSAPKRVMKSFLRYAVFAALAAFACPQTTPETANKYLLVSIAVEAGWGDSFRKYYDLIALAALTHRTLVLEPFSIHGPGTRRLEAVDPDEVLKAPQEDWVWLQRKNIDYQDQQHVTVPFGDWLDVPKLQEEYPQVITLEDWMRTSRGIVHTALIQAQRQHSIPLPEFSKVCTEHSAQTMPSDVAVTRLGRKLVFQRTVCINRQEVGAALTLPEDSDSRANTPQAVADWLNARYAAAPTLAFDISHYWVSPFRVELRRSRNALPLSLSPDAIRRAVHLNPDVYAAAAKFLREKGVEAPYVCFHWRRGDVSVDLASSFLPHNVAWAVPRLKTVLRRHATSFSGLVLVTDSPYRIEIERFTRAVRAETGLRVVRHRTGDPAKDVPVDLALGAKAELLLGNYPGSFFADWMHKERAHHGLHRREWLTDVDMKDEL